MARKLLYLVLPAILIASYEIVRHEHVRTLKSPASALSNSISNTTKKGDPENPSTPNSAARAMLLEKYGALPLAFEANEGQIDARVRFLSRGVGYTLLLTSDEALLSLPERKTNGKWLGMNNKNAVYQSPVVDRPLPSYESNLQKTSAILRMRLLGSNPNPAITGVRELPGKTNYFLGNDPRKWRTNAPTYAKVKYENVYPGVDLIYYGNHSQLEYDFVLSPGANVDHIKLHIGAESGTSKPHPVLPLQVAADGGLRVNLDGSEIDLHKPIAYQIKDSGVKDYVETHYVLGPKESEVSLAVASYDRRRPLVIDPVVSYSTYLNPSDGINSLAVDASGNVYVTGSTHSNSFLTTPGAVQTTCPAGSCVYGGGAFVTKINATGSAVVYSTYLSGSNANSGSYGNSIAVDSLGNAYVTGNTGSADFPITAGAFQTVCHDCANNSNTGFVTKLNSTGSALGYSTFLGGSVQDSPGSIALDVSGNAYITGGTSSTDFPTTPGSFQATSTTGGAFVTKLNPQGSALVYSTYLGSNTADGKIVVSSAGNAYVAGDTQSPTFPTTPGAVATSCNKCGPGTDAVGHPLTDLYVAELNNSGSALIYSTFVGGSDADFASGVALDPSGNVYVTGETYSNDFPTTPGAFQTTCGGGSCSGQLADVFVFKLNPTGSALLYSTLVGGSSYDSAGGITLDGSGDVYLGGQTLSQDFPVTNGAFQTQCNKCTLTNYSGDAFILEMNPSGTSLLYSTYMGGSGEDYASSIALDSVGDIYVAGGAYSTDFPTTPGSFQPTSSGSPGGAFVAKFAAGSTSGTDFSLSPATGSGCPSSGNCSPSATITAGQTATYNLQLVPVNGFNGTVTLSCGGSPSPSTCSVSPGSVPPNGTSDSPITVTVTNTSGVASVPFLPFARLRPRVLPIGLFLLAPLSAVSILMWMGIPGRSQKCVLAPVSLLLVACVGSYCAGCGTGSTVHTPSQSQPNPVNATLTVTGTSGTLTHTLNLSLTVNP
jgi:hypothetical protein